MAFTVHTPAQLGRVLRGQRTALKLTQREAADVVGLLQKTVSRLERDTDTATLDSLFKLLSALQLELVLQPKQSQSATREW
jgi:HTH-type transcriptional regulator/antitoxin HipB